MQMRINSPGFKKQYFKNTPLNKPYVVLAYDLLYNIL